MYCDIIIPVTAKDMLKATMLVKSFKQDYKYINTFIFGLDNYSLFKYLPFEFIIFVLKIFLKNKIIIVRHKGRKFASENRQILSNISTSEILFYQDADDLPHPFRISHILDIFEKNPECLHLCHCYCYKNENFKDLTGEIVSLSSLWNYYFSEGYEKANGKTHRYGKHLNLRLALGTPVIRRKILEKVKWKTKSERKMLLELGERGEDHEFNMDCLYHYNKSFAFLDKPYKYMRTFG